MAKRSVAPGGMGWVALLLPAFAGLAPACSESTPPPSAAADGPSHLVLISVDTLRADHLAPLGAKADTPSSAALARDGTAFPEAFSQVPMTLPAHAVLLAARHPFETGVHLNGQVVPTDLPLLAPWLVEQGYRAFAAVSLATMWPFDAGQGLDRGFEVYRYDPEREIAPAEELHAQLAPLFDRLGEGGEPFFLFAHYSDPHEPYRAHGSVRRTVAATIDGRPVGELEASELGTWRGPFSLEAGVHELVLDSADGFKLREAAVRAGGEELPLEWTTGGLGKIGLRAAASFTISTPGVTTCEVRLWAQDALSLEEQRARYRLEVEAADRWIGKLLDELRSRGLYDRSLIVLTSDHGEALGEHGLVGHVASVYDELLRVPLIVKLPAGHPRAAELAAAREKLVRQLDVVPTLLDLLELPKLPGQVGTSLLEGTSRVLLAQTHRPLAPRDLFCLRDERFKLILDPAAERFELYDLSADPGELDDVFATRGDERRDWQNALRKVAERTSELTNELDADTLKRLRALGY